ncbi:MAG TPA: ModD protein [Bacillota bacterium]|nr:ModD protein [Bacillota bacterium]
MIFFSNEDIGRLIKEDVPYLDLTGIALGISDQQGSITYFTREDAVVCGTEEVRQVFSQLHIDLDQYVPSGRAVKAGDVLIAGKGSAADLHMAWKVCQNILDHCSGIATKTRKMVDTVKSYNPDMPIFTTRKGFPGTKALAIKSILAGGAMPHRLGISETILVFKQHMNFIGGIDGFLAELPRIKAECCEKRVIVEADSVELALRLCQAGVDGIQFDKIPLKELKPACDTLKSEYPGVVLLAAGGINETNISDYAQIRIDGIVTTSLYHAKPIDVGVRIERLP